MTVHINAAGTMFISAESLTEEYALKKWIEDYYANRSVLVIEKGTEDGETIKANL